MKLLLDENLPKRLKLDFINHIVFTVRDMGWNGKKNGELMELLIANKFDALLTFDKNLQFLQNFEKYKLPVIVLPPLIAISRNLDFKTKLPVKVLPVVAKGNCAPRGLSFTPIYATFGRLDISPVIVLYPFITK
jgi:hypothetical protein